MPKGIIAGNSFILTSSMTLEDLKLLKQLKPEALSLYEKEEPVFTVSTEGVAGVNQYGATFRDESRDGSGRACITIDLSGYDGDDVKGYVADKFGGALINLGKLEEVLPAVVRDIKMEKAHIVEQIEVC